MEYGELFRAVMPILGGVLRGKPIGEILSGLSFKQWSDISHAILKVEAPEIRKMFQEHPIFKQLLQDILKEAPSTAHITAAANAHAAALKHVRK